MKLSLCMIARDEQAMIGPCLQSVVDVVDELVVVDTGSQDDTVAVCEAAGARVEHFRWCDDFSAARNHALQAATGDWVLWLDADERLAPDAGPALRAAIADATLDGGLLPLHNAATPDADVDAVLRGQHALGSPVLLLRLMRVTPDLAWEGAIHETVGRWTRKRGGRIRPVDAHIVHLGNAPALRQARHKDARDIALLQDAVAAHPDDPTPLIYLGTMRLQAGDTTEARTLLERAWSLVDAQRAPGEVVTQVPLVHSLAQLRLAAGQLRGASELLQVAIESGNRHPNLLFWQARTLAGAVRASGTGAPDDARLGTAIDLLQECLACASNVYPSAVTPGITGDLARAHLAQCHLLRGDATAAVEASRAAAPRDDDHGITLRLTHIEALIEAGEAPEALRLVRPLQQAGLPDAHVLAALCCDRLRDSRGTLQGIRAALAAGLPKLRLRHLAARCQALITARAPRRG